MNCFFASRLYLFHPELDLFARLFCGERSRELFFFRLFLVLCVNLDTYAEILIAFQRSHLSMSWSSSCSACSATTNNSLRVLASAFVSFVMLVMMSGGQFAGSDNHSGPRHQSLNVWFTFGLRHCLGSQGHLGFPHVPTCLHSMYSSYWILRTRLPTNCLYSPLPRIQWSATVLSHQQKPLQTFLEVMEKVSGRVPEHQLQAATQPWLVPDYCCMTAKTAAETPFAMASPKA